MSLAMKIYSMRKLLAAANALLLFPIAFLAVRRLYPLGDEVRWGMHTPAQAHVLLLEMSCIITVLLGLSSIVPFYLTQKKLDRYLFFSATLVNGVIMILYFGLISKWRSFWQPGMDPQMAFGPIWSGANAELFADDNWIGYLFFLVPLLSIYSGLLSLALNRWPWFVARRLP
jgi:hypothetical protein